MFGIGPTELLVIAVVLLVGGLHVTMGQKTGSENGSELFNADGSFHNLLSFLQVFNHAPRSAYSTYPYRDPRSRFGLVSVRARGGADHASSVLRSSQRD